MATQTATASLQRRTIGVFSANVLVLGIGYVASILLARFLGADGRGLVAVIQTGTSVLAGLGGIGTQNAATYYASRRSRRRGQVLGNGLAHAGVLLVVSVALAFVLMGELQQRVAPHYDERIWLLAALLVPTFYLDVLVSNLLAAQSSFTLRNRLSIAGRIATAVATVAIVGWLGWGVPGAILSTAPTLLVPTIGGIRVLARNGLALSRPVQEASMRYGARAQVGALLHFLNARFDVLVLSGFASLATVGSYAIAQLVAELVLLFPNAMGYVLRAQVASGSRKDTLSGAALRLNGTLVVGCVLAVLVVGPAMIVSGFGPGYRSALVPLLAGGEVVITIALDLILIPRYGAIGAAVASVCAYGFYGIASIVTISRLDGVPAHRLLLAGRGELAELVRALRTRA
jgi:O-antigen/teichoic acid export membrane protein